MGLNQNTWKLNQWYAQDVAGNVSYTGAQGIYSWGSAPYGELGQNDEGAPARRSSPVQVGSDTTWSSITGYFDGYFYGSTKTDGTLWMWGANTHGSQGTNQGPSALTGRSSPTQIGSGTDWARAYAGSKTNQYATKTDGSLWAWGYGGQGQLGQNDDVTRSSPIQIPGTTWGTTDDKIGGGQETPLAIKTDGTLWVWGWGHVGQTGQNNTTSYSSPTQIGSGTDWAKVSRGGGGYGQWAIKTDGTLWSWGLNEAGQLGHNNRTYYSSPKQIPGTSWSHVRQAVNCNFAFRTDGTMWAIGNNGVGRLGLNTPESSAVSSPVQIPGTNCSDLVSCSANSVAIKTDGTLWSWGYQGARGSLGQNNQTNYSSPTQIPGTWISISASGQHTYHALKA